MKKSNNLRTGRHCVFAMHVHLVFVPKYRKKIFTKKLLKFLKNLFFDICIDFEANLIEFEGEEDHVHLLVEYPPKVAVSKLVNSLKGVSSRMIRKNFPETSKAYWKGGFWSPSYFSGSCGGASIELVKEYIENQQSPGN